MKTWLKDVNDRMFRLNPDVREHYRAKERTLQENIDYYRDKLRYALNEKEDVMKRFFKIDSNGCKPMIVEKITLDRIIKKHGNNGLINISAWRSELNQEENEKNTRELIKDLQTSGYRYLPGYGGYKDPELGEESDFEPSFNVFNFNTQGEPQDFEKLKEFGVSLAKKYNQSSVLVKAPNEPPIWLNGDGKRVSKNETERVFKNDAEQEYFTSLKSLEDVNDVAKQYYIRYCKSKGISPNWNEGFEKFKKEHSKEIPVSRRYTYDMEWGGTNECYVNPSPCTLNERRMRKSAGEILIDLEIV